MHGHPLKVGHPTDGRGVVTAGREGQCLEALEGFGGGIVVGAQAPLFFNHLDFAGELFRRQAQAGQTVGFQLEGHAQAVAGQHLVVGGVVVAGKGIFFGAQLAQYPRGLAGTELAAALEHHVFEGVGQAGFAGCLVTGADLVPELGHHHWRAVVFAHYQFQAVSQFELMGGLRGRVGGQCWQADIGQ